MLSLRGAAPIDYAPAADSDARKKRKASTVLQIAKKPATSKQKRASRPGRACHNYVDNSSMTTVIEEVSIVLVQFILTYHQHSFLSSFSVQQ